MAFIMVILLDVYLNRLRGELKIEQGKSGKKGGEKMKNVILWRYYGKV